MELRAQIDYRSVIKQLAQYIIKINILVYKFLINMFINVAQCIMFYCTLCVLFR